MTRDKVDTYEALMDVLDAAEAASAGDHEAWLTAVNKSGNQRDVCYLATLMLAGTMKILAEHMGETEENVRKVIGALTVNALDTER